MIYMDSSTNTAVIAGDEQIIDEEIARVVGLAADSTDEVNAVCRLMCIRRYIQEKLGTMPMWQASAKAIIQGECQAWADTEGNYYKSIRRLCHGDSQD